MSTRSRIGIEGEDGTVVSVYCHWDGYPRHNGSLLLLEWNSAEHAAALVGLGDISVLAGRELAEVGADQGGTVTYNRWRDEGTEAHIFPDRATFLAESADYSGAEYVYLYGPKGWEFSPTGRRARFRPLTLKAIMASE